MNKFYKYLIGVAIAALVIFLGWYFSAIIAYILASAVLALLGKPMVHALTRTRIGKMRISKGWAAGITLLAICCVIVGLLVLFIPLIFSHLNIFSHIGTGELEQDFGQPLASMQQFLNRMFGITESEFSITKAITAHIESLIDIKALNAVLASIVGTIANWVVAIFSVIFITFFFLREDHLFNNMVISLFPGRYEASVTRAMNSITRLLVGYFVGLAIESLALLVAIALTLALFGIPIQTAFLMGLIVGVLNVIPYIGPIIGGVLCIVIGIITPIPGMSAWDMTLIIGLTILGLKTLDMFILQPVLFSNKVSAHPLEIFLVILIAGSIAGVLGMLLAIPAYNVIRVFAKEFFNHLNVVQKLTENI